MGAEAKSKREFLVSEALGLENKVSALDHDKMDKVRVDNQMQDRIRVD